MITRMGLLTKALGLSSAAFRRYWREDHSRFGKALTVPCRYQQNHVREVAGWTFSSLQSEAAYDGFSQVSFPDIHAMRYAMTPEQNAEIIDDERNFLADITLITALSSVVLPLSRSTAASKLIMLFGRSKTVGPEAFQAEWCTTHTALARRLPMMIGYTQHLILERMNMHRLPIGFEDLPFDGVSEMWVADACGLDDIRDLAAFATLEAHSAEYCREVAAFLVDPIEIVPWEA